jgi:hypothetical protein
MLASSLIARAIEDLVFLAFSGVRGHSPRVRRAPLTTTLPSLGFVLYFEATFMKLLRLLGNIGVKARV